MSTDKQSKHTMQNISLVIMGIVLFVGIGYVLIAQRKTPRSSIGFHDTTETEVTILAASDMYVLGAYQHFSQSAYDHALADGKTVILNFYADWCPTCLLNEPIIADVLATSSDDSIVGFRVNFDTASKLKRTFNIFSSSIIIKVQDGKKIDQLDPVPVTTESFRAFIER